MRTLLVNNFFSTDTVSTTREGKSVGKIIYSLTFDMLRISEIFGIVEEVGIILLGTGSIVKAMKRYRMEESIGN